MAKKKKVLFKRPGDRVTDLKKHCEMVLKLGQDRKFKKANDELSRVAGQFKGEWRFHTTMGALLRLQDDVIGATAAYKEADQIKPEDSHILQPLGMLLLDQGDLSGVALLDAIIARDDLESSEIKQIKGRLEEVNQILARCSEDDFKRLGQLSRDGMKLIYEKDYKAAQVLFLELLEIDPMNDDGELYLGMCLLTSDNKEGAVKCFKNILQRTPKHEAANLYLMFARKGNDSLLEGLKKDLPQFIDAFNASPPPQPQAERNFFDV